MKRLKKIYDMLEKLFGRKKYIATPKGRKLAQYFHNEIYGIKQKRNEEYDRLIIDMVNTVKGIG